MSNHSVKKNLLYDANIVVLDKIICEACRD